MRAFLDPRYDQAAAFIERHGHTRPWTPADLAMCAVLRLHDEGMTAGYVWLHFVPDDPFRLHIHASLDRDWRGRAFTHQIASDVCALARLMGAERLVGRYATEREAAAWRRFFARFVPAEQTGCDVTYSVVSHGLLSPAPSPIHPQGPAGTGRVSQGPDD
jgi:hypothetical protein